jgi:hypothetical protein
MGKKKRRVKMSNSNGREKFKPDFICVGAVKAGTSFLYSALREHPEIYMLPNKDQMGYMEFNPDIYESQTPSSEIIHNNSIKIGDFNVGLIHNPLNAHQLYKFLGEDGKLIVCLREPVSRFISEYQMKIRDFNEIMTLTEAIKAENERTRFDDNLQYSYIARSLYFKEIGKLIYNFGKDRIKVIIFEDSIQRDFLSTMDDIFEFLEIDRIHASREIEKKDLSFYHDISKAPKSITAHFYNDSINMGGMHDISNMDRSFINKISITSDTKYCVDIDTSNEDSKIRIPTGVYKLKYGSSRRIGIYNGENIQEIAKIGHLNGFGDNKIAIPAKFMDESVDYTIHLINNHENTIKKEDMSVIFNSYFMDDVLRLQDLLGVSLSSWITKYS